MVKLPLLLLAMVFASVASADIKDPTRPVSFSTDISVADEQPAAEFSVSTILKRKKAAWAIINNQKVKVNESVDGALVLRIEADQVLLSIGDENRWFPLSQSHSLKKRLGE